MTPEATPTRDDLASRYLDQLPYDPYPVQEEALLAWFTVDEGLLVCTPTGTGKTLIAEAALFEALHRRQVAYYTTPLIALTEQKFREMQEAAVRWGFSADDVGLVTGNRRVNPEARVLVVVAEILLNRLLHPTAFDFNDVQAVVMDEFHSFADPQRGVVWELSLGLLPKHVRLLLLSATVGNSVEFLVWLRESHGRKLQLIQSTDRRVPLSFHWVDDQLLNEQIEIMSDGDDQSRRTPALVFCFNREECWSVAEQLKGKHLASSEQQKKLAEAVGQYDFKLGAGPKLKQVLLRGVGVHHAGLMPRYRRIVEELFQKKLLSVAVCTETLAAGINLPARSVVLTTLLKGPPGKKKVIPASAAHQMFGRAGRPQYDTQGYVYALTHEDDVKIARFKEKYDTIPEDTKDPQLIKAKKRLKKKMPTRRTTEQYWSRQQFEKLQQALPGKLSSRGELPWRLLAYLIQVSPDVDRLREFVGKRMLDPNRRQAAQKFLTRMLLTLAAGDFVRLEPEPPEAHSETPGALPAGDTASPRSGSGGEPQQTMFGALLEAARSGASDAADDRKPAKRAAEEMSTSPQSHYEPELAHPTPRLEQLLLFRSVNPLYGVFLVEQLGIADRNERIQALESVLDVPGSMAKHLKVPPIDVLPPGPLATTRLDAELIGRGLVTAEQLAAKTDQARTWEERWTPTIAEKLRMLFDAEFPGLSDVRTQPVWAAGEVLHLAGDFNKYVTSNSLVRQEGMIFRHLLRLILLCGEFLQLVPAETTEAEWQEDLRDIADRLTASCRGVDPESTDKAIEAAQSAPDLVLGEATRAV